LQRGIWKRPLAEVVSRMPRCAPLRLLEDKQVGCHFQKLANIHP
jgi:hypothetical protein